MNSEQSKATSDQIRHYLQTSMERGLDVTVIRCNWYVGKVVSLHHRNETFWLRVGGRTHVFDWAAGDAEVVIPTPTPTADDYLKGHKASGIKVGDKVKVLRKAEDHEGGWDCVWSLFMDQFVGREFMVESDRGATGFRTTGYWHLPYFVLEKVAEPAKGTKKTCGECAFSVTCFSQPRGSQTACGDFQQREEVTEPASEEPWKPGDKCRWGGIDASDYEVLAIHGGQAWLKRADGTLHTGNMTSIHPLPVEPPVKPGDVVHVLTRKCYERYGRVSWIDPASCTFQLSPGSRQDPVFDWRKVTITHLREATP